MGGYDIGIVAAVPAVLDGFLTGAGVGAIVVIIYHLARWRS